ncbi:MAG: FtsX-like permease family protein [Nitrospinota bacterium]|nr:FtsX-like permease family protein [Nitrospinota bacterium]
MNEAKLSIMAWRNLWRHKRRTLITLSAIAFGTFLAIIFTGIGDATYGGMIDLAARLGSGHVTIQHPKYLDKPTLNRTVTGVKEKSMIAMEDREVSKVVTRITGNVMLATAGESYGAGFIAIDPETEDANTFALMDDFSEGEMFATSRDKGIILGAVLAKNLGAKMGKKVVYTMTDKNGDITSGLARVSGIIKTGAPGVDLGLCILPIDTARKILGYSSDESTNVSIFINDQRDSDKVRNRLKHRFEPENAVHIWSETQPELAGFITMKVSGSKFFEMIIMILVAAGIFNTLFISVMERLREFGILMAIGMSPGGLFRLVMWESFWLGISGLIFSAIVTAWPYWYLNTTGLDMTAMVGEGNTEIAGVAFDPIMYVSIFPENLLLIVSAVMIATLLSGFYPALRAGRVNPVETIRLV